MISRLSKWGIVLTGLMAAASMAVAKDFDFKSENLSKAYTKYKSVLTRADTAYKKKYYECYCDKLEAMADMQKTMYAKLKLMLQKAKAAKNEQATQRVEKWITDLLYLRPLDLKDDNDENVEKYNARLAELDKKYKPRLNAEAGKRKIKIDTERIRLLRLLERETATAEKNNDAEQLKILQACKKKVETTDTELPEEFPRIKPQTNFALQVKPQGALGLSTPSNIFNDADEATYEAWICPDDVDGGNFLWDGNDEPSNDRVMGLRNGRVTYFYDEDDGTQNESMSVLSERQLKKKRWYYVVCVIKPGSTAIYIDGEPDVKRARKTPPHDDTSGIFLGCGRFHDKFWMAPYDGRITGVRVWRRALEDIEIFHAYHGISPERKSLIGEWNFSKGNPQSDYPRNVDAKTYGNARFVRIR